MINYPKTRRLPCGCYEEDWGAIVRRDYCKVCGEKEGLK